MCYRTVVTGAIGVTGNMCVTGTIGVTHVTGVTCVTGAMGNTGVTWVTGVTDYMGYRGYMHYRCNRCYRGSCVTGVQCTLFMAVPGGGLISSHGPGSGHVATIAVTVAEGGHILICSDLYSDTNITLNVWISIPSNNYISYFFCFASSSSICSVSCFSTPTFFCSLGSRLFCVSLELLTPAWSNILEQRAESKRKEQEAVTLCSTLDLSFLGLDRHTFL